MLKKKLLDFINAWSTFYYFLFMHFLLIIRMFVRSCGYLKQHAIKFEI